MEQTNQTTAVEAPTSQTGTQELVRPLEGRVLAGVSLALANRFDIPLWLPRALFVVTTIFGGVGLALYAAGWALIRSEDAEKSPAESFFSGASGSRSWIGIALIFVAALILLDNVTFLSGRVIWAVALLIAGILLYTGTIKIGSRAEDTESKEGVQQMTPSEMTSAVVESGSSAGDSPSGGAMPPTPTPTPPILPPSASAPRESSILGRLTIGFMLVGLGVLAALDNLTGVPIDAEPRHYMALAVTILGIGLLVGTFAGRARWLILVGVILVPTMMFSPIFEYDWDWTSDTFDVLEEPQTFTDLQDFYSVDVGNLVIDLTELPWDGEEVSLTARVDAGNLEIRVPDGVGLVGQASVDVGRVAAPGQESAGLGSPHLTFNDTGDDGTILLDASVDVGNIDIRR